LLFYGADNVVVEDVVNVGTPAVGGTVDCGGTFRFLNVLKAVVRNTHHYAVVGSNAEGLVSIHIGDLLLENSSFPGCRVNNGPVIGADIWQGFTARNVDFIDFGNAKGILWSKTLQAQSGTQAWIQIKTPITAPTTSGQRGVVIDNVRCDEGALWGVQIKPSHSGPRVSNVRIRQLACTVMSRLGAGGVSVDFTDSLVIDELWAGYTDQSHDAVSLTDVKAAELHRVRADVGLAGGPLGARTIRADAACGSLTLRECQYGTLISEAASTNIITGGKGGVVAKVKADGPPADTDFDTPPPDGTMAWGAASLYGRIGGSWIRVGATPAVPDAPGKPTATAGDTQATITWTTAAANSSVVTNYVITPYIGETAQPATTVGVVLTAVIGGLTNGATYTFRVAAINGIGTGPQSVPSERVTLPTSFSPTLIPGLQADYDPDGLVSLPDSSAVESLPNASGPAPAATQATAARQPILRKSVGAYNAHSVLRGNGSSYLRTSPFTLPQPATLFVVGNILDNTGRIFIDGLNGLEMFYGGQGAPSWTAYAGAVFSGPVTDFNPHIHCVEFNGITSRIHVDGGAGLAGNVGSRALTGITLMASGIPNNILRGDLARALLWNRVLTKDEKNQVGRYLAATYSLAWTAVP